MLATYGEKKQKNKDSVTSTVWPTFRKETVIKRSELLENKTSQTN